MAVMTLTMTMIIMMTMMMMPAMYGDGMVTMAMMVVMMAVAPWLHLGAPGPDYDVLWVWAHGAERPPQTFTNSTASDVNFSIPHRPCSSRTRRLVCSETVARFLRPRVWSRP